jgi:hypothetical protein
MGKAERSGQYSLPLHPLRELTLPWLRASALIDQFCIPGGLMLFLLVRLRRCREDWVRPRVRLNSFFSLQVCRLAIR